MKKAPARQQSRGPLALLGVGCGSVPKITKYVCSCDAKSRDWIGSHGSLPCLVADAIANEFHAPVEHGHVDAPLVWRLRQKRITRSSYRLLLVIEIEVRARDQIGR